MKLSEGQKLYKIYSGGMPKPVLHELTVTGGNPLEYFLRSPNLTGRVFLPKNTDESPSVGFNCFDTPKQAWSNFLGDVQEKHEAMLQRHQKEEENLLVHKNMAIEALTKGEIK